ncbi:MAG: hypothetical protein IJP35_00830 [Clostridia bacterium]|nr:hypothetical protein [Clostridia bacterium]
MKKQTVLFTLLGASVVGLTVAKKAGKNLPPALGGVGVTLMRQTGNRLMASIALKSLLGLGAVWATVRLCEKGYQKAENATS